MSKLREGFYKTVNNFYDFLKVGFQRWSQNWQFNISFNTIKVENGKITIRDGMGNEYSLTVEYGDFGEIWWLKILWFNRHELLWRWCLQRDTREDGGDEEQHSVQADLYRVHGRGLPRVCNKHLFRHYETVFDHKAEKYVENGVILEDGLRCVTKGHMGVSELIKITEEEKIKLENDFDPIEAPPGPYKIQPEVQGLPIDREN